MRSCLLEHRLLLLGTYVNHVPLLLSHGGSTDPYQVLTDSFQPTTSGTVTLVLLRGPSTNILPLYPIVEKIPNTGTYVWTPATNLQPDVTHYGIQLIDDQTGAYQYTSQFGISNPSAAASSPTTTIATTSAGSIFLQTSTLAANSSALSTSSATVVSASASTLVSGSPIYSANSSTVVTYVTVTGTAPLSTFVASTGGFGNTTVIQPTVSMSVPATLRTSTSTASGTASTTAAATSPVSTAAAGRLIRNASGALMILGAVVVFLF